MRKILFLPVFVLFFLVSGGVHGQSSPFHVETLQNEITLASGEEKVLELQISVPENHFIYKDKTEVEFISLGDLRIRYIQFPASRKHTDPFFKKTTEVYKGQVSVRM